MLRWLTAGESHGPALVAMIEGLPAGVEVGAKDLQGALSRRRLGYGRGARMSFEQDEVEFLGGLRHGLTLGSPIAVRIGNSEWPKWTTVMSPEAVSDAAFAASDDVNAEREVARNKPLTRPRPGHADLVGMQKYGHEDARPVLERASARETAARVALGEVAARFLEQSYGIRLVSHTVSIGTAGVPDGAALPTPDDVERLDADPVRAFDPSGSAAMVAEVDAARKDGDTLGGVVEVLAYGVPPGLGSHVHWDRKLDGLLAQALMSIQAMKGVEIGDGFEVAGLRGSQAHDEILWDEGAEEYTRGSTRAGGTEGGMTTGGLLVARVAMKPLATLNRPVLRTVDTTTKEETVSFKERTDVTAVPASGVVAETMTALVLANEVTRKFGGDSLDELVRNHAAYVASLRSPTAPPRAA